MSGEGLFKTVSNFVLGHPQQGDIQKQEISGNGQAEIAKECIDESMPALQSSNAVDTVDTDIPRFSTVNAIRETRLNEATRAFLSIVGTRQPKLLYYGQEKVIRMSPDQVGDYGNWFILGDLHGDYFALRNVVEHIKDTCPEFHLIFLGDLVDRGPHPMECLWYLLSLAEDYPGRILWIAGNHDIGVSYDQSRSCFRSDVAPSEFLTHLNEIDSWTPFRVKFGHEFVELIAGLPRAVLFPDGLLVTHGGFPHTDLQKDLSDFTTTDQKLAWLTSDQCLQDFTWTRITRYPSRMPNRASTGCSYGYKNFESFCVATQDFFPAKRLVTGHDHPEGGFDQHPEWKEMPALTLTGFGFDQSCYERSSAFNENYQDSLVIGRCCENDMPKVITINVDREDLASFCQVEIEKLMKVDLPVAELRSNGI